MQALCAASMKFWLKPITYVTQHIQNISLARRWAHWRGEAPEQCIGLGQKRGRRRGNSKARLSR